MAFYESIAPYYEHIFPINPLQIAFIKKEFKDDTNKILDIGCGVGLLIKELDKYYKHVHGLDLDEEMIKLAKEKKYLNKPVINQGNMLNFHNVFSDGLYDGIICLGNTLVHLNDENEIELMLNNCYANLATGGKLIIQIINYDRILKMQIDHLPSIDNEHILFVRSYEYLKDIDRINFATLLEVKKENRKIESEQILIPIRPNLLISLLEKCGFKIKEYGDFKGGQFSSESQPFIVVAQK